MARFRPASIGSRLTRHHNVTPRSPCRRPGRFRVSRCQRRRLVILSRHVRQLGRGESMINRHKLHTAFANAGATTQPPKSIDNAIARGWRATSLDVTKPEPGVILRFDKEPQP